MATVLDTHRIAKRFKDAGVPDAQADVLLETLVEWRAADVSQLASKDDLRLLTADVRGELATSRADLEDVRTELKAEMSALRADLKAELATMKGELRAEIIGSKVDILKWTIPLLAGQILALMALVVQLALKGP